jgi:hypothetical protein
MVKGRLPLVLGDIFEQFRRIKADSPAIWTHVTDLTEFRTDALKGTAKSTARNEYL